MRKLAGLALVAILGACGAAEEKSAGLPPLPDDPCGTEEWAVEQVYAQQRSTSFGVKAVDFEETTVKRDGDSCRYRVETVQVITQNNGDVQAYRFGFDIQREEGSRVWSYAMPELITSVEE